MDHTSAHTYKTANITPLQFHTNKLYQDKWMISGAVISVCRSAHPVHTPLFIYKITPSMSVSHMMPFILQDIKPGSLTH